MGEGGDAARRQLDDRSIGWLRYLYRKTTTPDSWDRDGARLAPVDGVEEVRVAEEDEYFRRMSTGTIEATDDGLVVRTTSAPRRHHIRRL